MLHSGLVSITFRPLSPREIVDLVAEAGLEGIEWGGDIHVPHGDLPRAREVARMTADVGLKVAAYGSYYIVGKGGEPIFEDVLSSALELGAPTIRVWAGEKGSVEVDSAYRNTVIDESRRIADLAASAGLTVSFEFHGNTLTDTNDSADRFYREVAHDAVMAYWQPPVGAELEYNLEGLSLVLPRLSNIHCFCWRNGRERLPISDGADEWGHYLRTAAFTGHEHYVLIEFVRDDAPGSFLQDAGTLKSWIAAPRS